MRYSQLLIPTLREDPGEVDVISHRLMVRAGMIRKLASGVYNYLPLGYRVLRKVENIVRDEMNRAGAQEILMPVLQPAELWKETGRWDQYGKELFRLKDRHDREFCLGPTHEEIITDLVRREVRSYRQLPMTLYQIQVKFRDEVRPRFGLMRGREFFMKDAYSFDQDEAGAKESYEKMREAYKRTFSRCGLNFKPVEAESGLIGGAFSQEFMVLADTGEDAIVTCTACDYAANVEKIGDQSSCPRCKGKLETKRGIEVGHVFMLGTKYSEAMRAVFLDRDGKEQFMIMGCYGIGIGRTAAAAIEQNHDEKGMIWPASIAPFHVHLLPLAIKSENFIKTAEQLYQSLNQVDVEVLWDDRDERPGVKFNDADLIGIPYQLVLGDRNLKEGLVEIKDRKTGQVTKTKLTDAVATLKNLLTS
ncbi:MAG: proline--tRNA ligase [Nitrospira sp.]|nr:proline--tRNA ligase [Nitrospira sp.]